MTDEEPLYVTEERCKVCTHPERGFIESQVFILGKPLETCLKWLRKNPQFHFDAAKSSFWNHFQRHVNKAGFLEMYPYWKSVIDSGSQDG